MDSRQGDQNMTMKIDAELLAKARIVAEKLVTENRNSETIKVSDTSKVTVTKDETLLDLVLSDFSTNNGSTFYVGLGKNI